MSRRDRPAGGAGGGPRYREVLRDLRTTFPQPCSDLVHDAYMVLSISRALDQVDGLKSHRPILGQPADLDWQAARASRLDDDGAALETVIAELVEHLNGMFIWGHPRCQANVVTLPSIASIIGVLLPSVYNPNLCSDEYSLGVARAEVEAVSILCDLVGYAPDRATGVFTFGGTGGLLYGLKVGLEKAVPGSLASGVRERAVVLASDESHFCVLNAAGWLGIGHDNVVRVRTHSDNSIDVGALEEAARAVLEGGGRIAAIVATMGTTDAFGLDDLAAVHQVRERLVREFALPYRPHLHADAAIGWAWAVFRDYGFAENPLGFRPRTVAALARTAERIRHLALADTIGLDFHKTGFAPYISSAVLFRERGDLALIARDRATMPYLFQSGAYHPGLFTLETSRGGGGPMAALANLRLFGRTGLRSLLGHVVEMAEVLREDLEGHPDIVVLNAENVGPVTLFRVYPEGSVGQLCYHEERTDPALRERLEAHNELNRRLYRRVHERALAGLGVVISETACYRHTEYGAPIVGLKSFVLSPFSERREMRSIVEHVRAARREMAEEEAARGAGAR